MISKLVLDVGGTPHKYEGHLSENPIKDIWEELLLYTDTPILKKHWSTSGITDEMRGFVVTALKQSHEYYMASNNTSLVTKPLVLYYSIHCLTKAILTIINDQMCAPYHGLCSLQINNGFFPSTVNLNNGIFRELGKTLGVSWGDAKTFSIASLIGGNLELFSDYGNIYDGQPSIIPTMIERKSDGTIRLTISEAIMGVQPHIRNSINQKPGFSDDFIEDTSSQSPGLVYRNKNVIPEGMYEIVEHGDPMLNKYLTFSLMPHNPKIGYLDLNNGESRMPQPCNYYALMYVLSSIARYHPAELNAWTNDPSSTIRWLINKICDRAARLYPNYMLNLLLGKQMKFSPAFQL